MNKIYPKNELKAEVDRLKRKGKKVIFTNGCFDILHAGHTRYLREAKKLGDVLILALNSDKSVRSIKGEKRPIVPEPERAEVVASLASVDYVTVFDEPTPLAAHRISSARCDCQGGGLGREGHCGSGGCPQVGGPGGHHARDRGCLDDERD